MQDSKARKAESETRSKRQTHTSAFSSLNILLPLQPSRVTRWRLRRSTHSGGMATDHDATARVARSTPASLTVIKDAPNAVGGARRSSASILEPSSPARIAGGRQPRIMRTQGGALVRAGSPGVGSGRLLHRPSPRRRRGMGPGL